METLDVTKIEPRLKYPSIFEKFDVIGNNESFILHNDHDPKPLYYQMMAELGEVFLWEYQEEGPDVWEVQITKVTKAEKMATIGEMVAEDYRKAEVFRKYGLDFCCGGKKSVKEACDKKGIERSKVEQDLVALDKESGAKSDNFNAWELDFLTDYIINNHHRYVEKSIPMLYEYSQKVAKVHGESSPETIEIASRFQRVADELTSHMKKEEEILFPYIKRMVAAQKENKKIETPSFGTIKNPINMMEAEHDAAGDDIERIHELSNDFEPPASACSTFRVLYSKLDEFEKDLHQHIHLENNILFKKVIVLEEEIMA